MHSPLEHDTQIFLADTERSTEGGRAMRTAAVVHVLIGRLVAVLLSCVVPQAVWAQSALENPQPGSFQSGAGVISGWVCDASLIEIVFNDTSTFEAAYGTSRGDTISVCGDDNNGFGLLFNWNLLGAGAHTVRALADGQEFASATFTVTSFGTEFLAGASGEFPIQDFPQAGTDILLRWQESAQNFAIRGATESSGGNSGSSPRILENPQPGSFQSGAGMISGWVCDADLIEIVFDDTSTFEAAYGTSRGDTIGPCGDADNGFGLLFNWNLLGAGSHTVRALADGQEFAHATVTVTTLGAEFLQDVGKHERLEDFPQVGTDVIVAWQASLQNFVIARVDTLASRIQSMDATGDSFTKAFNAQSRAVCPFDDQESFSWATSVTNESTLCSSGDEGVFSQAENLECRQGAPIIHADPNSAESGAQMLKDFVQQASSVATFLQTQSGPRYTTVMLGHNDICAGDLDKVQDSCGRGSDQDPSNHCRTTPEAFEREFRKGLDILMTVPELKIGVASLVRMTQLCNHDEKSVCNFLPGSCQDFWTVAATAGPAFGLDHGVCGSLTIDCSDERIRDAYTLAQAYHDILADVTSEYAAIVPGEMSRVVTIGGETVGGATQALGVQLTFSNASWEYKFGSEQLSCCDCFHPSFLGQDLAARVLFDGFTCSESDVCCADTGDALADGLCTGEETSGRFVPGLF